MDCVMIILNYKDSERAISLAKRCEKFCSIEKIIIVDNDSKDNSYEKINKISNEKIDVLKADKNRGFAAGNNVGAKYAVEKYNPQYIFFANTDTIFEESNILKCKNVLNKDDSLGLVSMRMIGPDKKEQTSHYKYPTFYTYISDMTCVGNKINFRKKKSYNINETEKQTMKYVDIVRGSFMFFRAKALEKSKYFDENTFLYCEETIIAKRLNLNGYRVGLITDSFYIHDHIENVDNTDIVATKRLFESRYYVASKYMKINSFQKVVFKIFMKYAIGRMQLMKKLWRE